MALGPCAFGSVTSGTACSCMLEGGVSDPVVASIIGWSASTTGTGRHALFARMIMLFTSFVPFCAFWEIVSAALDQLQCNRPRRH